MEKIEWNALEDKNKTEQCAVCGSTENITSYYNTNYCQTHLKEEKKRRKKQRIQQKQPSSPQINDRIATTLEQILAVMKSNTKPLSPPSRQEDEKAIPVIFEDTNEIEAALLQWLLSIEETTYPNLKAGMRAKKYGRLSPQDKFLRLFFIFLKQSKWHVENTARGLIIRPKNKEN